MNIKIKLIPYERLKKNGFNNIMKDLKENKIILIDAKLNPEEESFLIENTMKRISGNFTGIELSSLNPANNEKTTGFEKIRNRVIETIIGKKRGITIIGPAKLVRKIEKNPQELLLYM